ncbi:MAG: P1 family peptidase [Tepidiformaceae bacterium]
MTLSTGWREGPRNAITDVPGIRVGHFTDRKSGTGCTVILCEDSTGAAVDARGGAPGTRETDVLDPANVVRKCHAVVFSGGSAFGLASAQGVMRWCAERDIGFPTKLRNVPIVSAAVLFDLGVGDPMAFPDEAAGYTAASRAKGGGVAEGSAGAGTGATVAKLLGPERAVKGGVGTASVVGPKGIIVGALVVSNAVGSVFDPETGACMAGPRAEGGGFVPLPEAMERRTAEMDAMLQSAPLQNTTLMCVATNAALGSHELQRLAFQAHDGFARVIVPAHTFGDGDVAFAIAMGKVETRPDEALTVGMLASRAVEQALLRSVRMAKGAYGVPAAGEVPNS